MSTEVAAAVALKDQGNKAFAAHDWPSAIEFYTKAIEKDPNQPTYYSNRAQVCLVESMSMVAWLTCRLQANIKSEAYGYAIADATKAIEIDPNFVKVRDYEISLRVLCKFLTLSRLTIDVPLHIPLSSSPAMQFETSRLSSKSSLPIKMRN
jgi:tetratricopeptide (TPR) repeat protein